MSKKLQVCNDEAGGYSPPAYYKEQPLAKIDVDNEESLQKWESVLHMSRAEILEAIACFGPVVRDIRRGLRANRNDEAA